MPSTKSTTTGSPPAGERRAKRGRRKGRAARRAELEAAVLEEIGRGEGLAVADVAKAVGVPKPRVSAVLRSLRDAGAIHAAGDRRFTRYGKTKAIAVAASKNARKS